MLQITKNFININLCIGIYATTYYQKVFSDTFPLKADGAYNFDKMQKIKITNFFKKYSQILDIMPLIQTKVTELDKFIRQNAFIRKTPNVMIIMSQYVSFISGISMGKYNEDNLVTKVDAKFLEACKENDINTENVEQLITAIEGFFDTKTLFTLQSFTKISELYQNVHRIDETLKTMKSLAKTASPNQQTITAKNKFTDELKSHINKLKVQFEAENSQKSTKSIDQNTLDSINKLFKDNKKPEIDLSDFCDLEIKDNTFPDLIIGLLDFFKKMNDFDELCRITEKDLKIKQSNIVIKTTDPEEKKDNTTKILTPPEQPQDNKGVSTGKLFFVVFIALGGSLILYFTLGQSNQAPKNQAPKNTSNNPNNQFKKQTNLDSIK